MPYTLDLPCPACGGSRTTQIASREQVLAEVESLWAFHGARLSPEVPPRHLLDRVVFSQEPPLRLVRCDGCATVLREPRERPDSLTAAYAGEPTDPGVMAALLRAQEHGCRAQARRLTALLGRPGSGLEVGSYVGAFLAAARGEGWRFEGVDVNRGANDFARGHGLHVTEGTLEAVAPERRFDAIAIWNCFEQLPDPRASLRSARSRLRVGGVLALRVPNGAFYAALRRRLDGPLARPAVALLALNNLLSFPYRHGFTPASLRALLQGTGFQLVRVLGDVLVRTADDWTRPWAAAEERLVKGALRPMARLHESAAPWFELYARAA